MLKRTLVAGVLSFIVGFSSFSVYAQVEQQYLAAKQTMIMSHKMEKAALAAKHKKEEAAFKAVWQKAGISNAALTTESSEVSDFREALKEKIQEFQNDGDIDVEDEETIIGKLEQWKKEYDDEKAKKAGSVGAAEENTLKDKLEQLKKEYDEAKKAGSVGAAEENTLKDKIEQLKKEYEAAKTDKEREEKISEARKKIREKVEKYKESKDK